MIKWLIAIPALIIATIIGLSVYLQPDDLRQCRDVIGTEPPCRPVDAVIALSGGDTNARTDEAIRLYKSGWSRLLIFSGAAEDKSGPSNAEAMRRRALDQGVAPAAIYIDEYSETTSQNAANTQSILERLKIREAILVTSGYHQRRASLEFAKGTKDTVIYNSPLESDQDWSPWWWTNFRGWSLALSELVKIIVMNFGVNT